MAIFLIALVGGARAVSICNIDSAKLNECRPAVTGNSPKPPTKKCCDVVHQANLPCLCNYKSAFPAFGINPALAMALPKKCGMSTPRECHGKIPKLCMVTTNMPLIWFEALEAATVSTTM
ncbi:putative lipid-transfer protein DIR1 [Prunus dulcis]|uniref:putative lipid-transfer protein DIR1 n=1 Tax=Prunus dulcis TaxID=3755 RepID=UPI00148398FC|nr:putative lipid-transfer protein DIR1 [Prunus dulcis]